jgi:hypothetical protein
VTLCPATCSFTEMVTVHLRLAGDGRTYPHAEPVTKFPLRSWHALAVALVRPRQVPKPIAALDGVRWGYSRLSRKHAPGGC